LVENSINSLHILLLLLNLSDKQNNIRTLKFSPRLNHLFTHFINKHYY